MTTPISVFMSATKKPKMEFFADRPHLFLISYKALEWPKMVLWQDKTFGATE